MRQTDEERTSDERETEGTDPVHEIEVFCEATGSGEWRAVLIHRRTGARREVECAAEMEEAIRQLMQAAG